MSVYALPPEMYVPAWIEDRSHWRASPFDGAYHCDVWCDVADDVIAAAVARFFPGWTYRVITAPGETVWGLMREIRALPPS